MRSDSKGLGYEQGSRRIEIIDRSTSCDLEAGNNSNSTKRPCSAGQGRSPRLGGTPSNSMSLWEYHTALGTPPRLQISFPIQKSIKMLKFLSTILFPMVLGAPWTDFDDPGLFEKLSFSTFRQCFFVVECLRGFLWICQRASNVDRNPDQIQTAKSRICSALFRCSYTFCEFVLDCIRCFPSIKQIIIPNWK